MGKQGVTRAQYKDDYMKQFFGVNINKRILLVASALLVIILIVSEILLIQKPWISSAPVKPSGVTATPRSCSVLLSWKSNSEADLTGYNVYVNGIFKQKYGNKVTSAVLVGLLGGAEYTISIAAIDSARHVSAKASVIATPLAIKMTQTNPVSVPKGSFPEYSKFMASGMAGAIVPGLNENMVPQGLGYISSKNWIIISYYNSDNEGSMFSIVDATSGILIKSLGICDVDKKPYQGHAGGVTVSAANIWIASEGYLRRIPIQDIINAPDGTQVYVTDRFLTGTDASFAMVANGVLWSGEFYHVGDYPTSASREMTSRDGIRYHSWMTGFKLNSTTDALESGKFVDDKTQVTPDYILSIPDIVQGAETLPDGEILLSESYGRGNDSTIQCFENVLTQDQHSAATVNGKSVPVWFLDGKSLKSEMTAFPMAEGIIVQHGLLNVLFESGASEYCDSCKYPVGNIWGINLSLF